MLWSQEKHYFQSLSIAKSTNKIGNTAPHALANGMTHIYHVQIAQSYDLQIMHNYHCTLGLQKKNGKM